MGYTRLLAGGVLLLGTNAATALDFDFYDIGVTWNNRLTLAAGWRVEERDPDLIGKLNLNPFLCQGDDCLSLSGDPEPNQRLVDAPGGFFADKQDDGNMNYDRGDLYSALAKVTSDLSLSWNDYTLKTRVIAFFDGVNQDLDETHFNNCQVFGNCGDNGPGVGGYQFPQTRRDDGVNDVVGASIRVQDLALSGTYFLGERLLTVGIGQQKVRWGEANLIALNSLNEINPPDVRGLRQPGGQISEIFQPVPMVLLSGDLFPDLGITGEAFYQLQWKPVVADAGGSLFGELDALYREGTNAYAAINLGQFPEDPIIEQDGRLRGRHRLQNEAAFLLTDTSFSAEVLDGPGEPRDDGQFGLKISWFADMINNGTELGFYAMNYHSRLPYLSFFATDRSPLRDGTGTGLEVLTSCTAAGNDCLPVDTARVLVDYPEDIRLFGVSFNTNIGSWSVAGEYSFRPNVPVQVSMPDVFFAALQPAFPEEPIVIGAEAIGAGVLDDILGPGAEALVGEGLPITVPGARTGAPDFLETLYRGNGDVDRNIAERGENYYIPGFVRLKVGQFVMSGIRILGSSHPVSSLIGAEQIIMLLEGGFTHVVDMPSRELVQFDGGSPNRTHASPGADGTGLEEGEEQNTGTFNPTQQTEAFVDDFSWGYRFLAQMEYNDVFWGLNLKPFFIAAHDVQGYAPAPQQNFLEGRIEGLIGTEWFLGQQWSGRIFYNLHEGNRHNVRRDKDNLVVELSYTF